MSRSKRKGREARSERADQNVHRTWAQWDLEHNYRMEFDRGFQVEPSKSNYSYSKMPDPVPVGQPQKKNPSKRGVNVGSSTAYYTPMVSVGDTKPVREAVRVCQERQTRREVLHAEGHAGRGGNALPKWTNDSKIHCRRK